jgi:predicted nucleic acid-binding Zn ribbon protein
MFLFGDYLRTPMTTYVYETIPTKSGQKPRRYEIRQSMKDDALTAHPETGEPIRRIVLGGYGVLKSGQSAASMPSPSGGGHCCGGSGCGCH